MIKTQEQVEYASVDLCKFFMAIVVIAIHVHPFEGYASTTLLDVYNLLCGCAVPFFFLCTGYFMAQKILYTNCEQQLVIMRRYVKKLLRLYLIWTLVYLPLTILAYCTNTTPWWKDIIYFIYGFVIVGEHYNSWILWYLLSGIYGLIFIYFLRKRNVSWEKILLLGCIFYLCCSVVTQILPKSTVLLIKFISPVNRIFTSFFFIPMGIFIGKVGSDRWRALCGMCLAIVLWCIGGDGLSIINKGIIALGAVGIFAFVINVHFTYRNLYRYMRTSSTVLYFLHLWIWTLVYGAFYGEKTYGMDMFVLTLLLTLGISLIYILYKNKKATAL